MKKAYKHVYQFKISLKGITPQIWRRIQVPETCTFWDLSVAIQDVMSWEGHHLHAFTLRNPKTGFEDEIGIPDEEFDRHVLKGWKTKISAYFSMENKKALFVYDFGDWWEHAVTLEKILTREPGREYPCCIAGKRNAPPDDVGSIPGYEEFVGIMKNPRHKEHDEMVEWYGGSYDPEDFDCGKIQFNDPDVLLTLVDDLSS